MNTKTDSQAKYKITLITGESNREKNTDIIDNIIGQYEVCSKLKFFVLSDSPVVPFPSMLFTGSKGLGKSHTAQKTAEALGREYIEVNCESIETEKDFVEGVLLDQVAGPNPKTLLMDEAHRLTKGVASVLLSFLNPNVTNKNIYNYNGWPIEYDFSKINIIFATTEEHLVLGPLKNRCEDVYFQPYSNDDLFKIMKHYLPGINLRCGKKELAEACRGRARNAFKLSQHIIRHCSMKGTKTFDSDGWNNLKEVFSIYPLGLNSQEVNLLKLLKNYAPLSCRNMAVRLGVDENNVSGELETRPRELGLIENTSKGRCLTNEGMKYVENISKSS